MYRDYINVEMVCQLSAMSRGKIGDVKQYSVWKFCIAKVTVVFITSYFQFNAGNSKKSVYFIPSESEMKIKVSIGLLQHQPIAKSPSIDVNYSFIQ